MIGDDYMDDNVILERLVAMEQKTANNAEAIKELERRTESINDLASSVKILALKQEGCEHTITEIRDTLKAILEKPAKNWASLTSQTLGLVISAVVSLVFVKIGLQ